MSAIAEITFSSSVVANVDIGRRSRLSPIPASYISHQKIVQALADLKELTVKVLNASQMVCGVQHIIIIAEIVIRIWWACVFESIGVPINVDRMMPFSEIEFGVVTVSVLVFCVVVVPVEGVIDVAPGDCGMVSIYCLLVKAS